MVHVCYIFATFFGASQEFWITVPEVAKVTFDPKNPDATPGGRVQAIAAEGSQCTLEARRRRSVVLAGQITAFVAENKYLIDVPYKILRDARF